MNKRIVSVAAVCLGSLAAMLPAAAVPQAGWVPVGDAMLEEARGGFEMPGGLNLSLGVERLVSVNGNVVSSASFMIADVARLSVEEAVLARAAVASMNVLQNGAGNVFLPGALEQTMAGTVIQNTLNDQVLRTQTIVHTSVNSLELLKMANFQDTLQQSLGSAAGSR